MSERVELESIRGCLEPSVPAPLATCDPDGTPHISYIQQVQYLDPERVGTSRQAFNRALHTLPVSSFSQALVVCVGTGEQYRLDLRYLHTETRGEPFEAIRANLDASAAPARIDPAFRLRGLDVHRVIGCTRLPHERPLSTPARGHLALVEEFARRLQRCSTRKEAGQELLAALEDIFDIPYAILFTRGVAAQTLLATAASGAARGMLSATVTAGAGMIGTAAGRRRLIVTANLQRARALAGAAAESGDPDDPLASLLPGLPDARNAAAVPLIVGEDLLGVLYLESAQPGAFSGPVEGLLHILGAYTAAALAARAEPSSQSPALSRTAPPPGGPRALQLVYYQADDTVLCDSTYIVKGAPGRILWGMLSSHVESGRTQFTNRELRLDESLELPAGHDNLESRLLVLRRRLAGIDCGVTLERVGRGRLELRLQRPARLTVVPTAGPMRSAHVNST